MTVLSFNLDELKLEALPILPHLLKTLTTCPTHNNDNKYWSLLIIHQFSLSESIHQALIENGIIPILGTLARLTFGNSQMQKLCLHSLVRIISCLEPDDAITHLFSLKSLRVCALCIWCLRNDDVELVSWAVFLMHEFIIKDVYRKEYSETKGLVRVLVGLLAEDQFLPRIILRALKCLINGNQRFQKELIAEGIVKKTIPFLKSSDEETQYWALSVLHDIMNLPSVHSEFFDNKGLTILNFLCNQNCSVHVSLYIADILVFLCETLDNCDTLLESNIIDSIFCLCKNRDADVVYGGVSLLLNLTTLNGFLK